MTARVGVAEDLIVGRGNVGLAEQVFAEDFAAFELGGGFRWAEDAELFGLEGVDDAGDQRRFGTDDGEADVVFLGEADEAREIGGGEIDVFGIERRAGVAGSDEDAAYARALFDFPGQGVFAAAVADDKNVHGWWSGVPAAELDGSAILRRRGEGVRG